MAKILLDYVFPISTILSVPAASTAFLKQVCLVCKPKSGQSGNVGTIFECTTTAQVAARTDNLNASQLFNGGMTKVLILLMDDLDLEDAMEEYLNDFFTVLISDDFIDADITASQAARTLNGDLTFTSVGTGSGQNDITIALVNSVTAGNEVCTVVGKAISIAIQGGVSTATQIKTAFDASAAALLLATCAIVSGQGAEVQAAAAAANFTGGDGLFLGQFEGVTGLASWDDSFCSDQNAIENRVCFFTNSTNKSKNMCYAFGKLLSGSSWTNQQYITMPFDDGVDILGDAVSLFDDKTSFVIDDEEFGSVLALFAAGGKAIVAPYITKNFMIDLQSKAIQWIASNQPQYTLKEAALLETRLIEDVVNSYINRRLISDGTVEITLVEDNFVASGAINIAEPKSLWRVSAEMRQTL